MNHDATSLPLVAGYKVQATGCKKKICVGFSLFELLVSLALVAFILMLLVTAEMQATTLWRELDEEEEFVTEGSVLMQMICSDLRSATPSSPIELGKNLNLFFLRRTTNDDFVTVGYFLDPNKKNHCYRFFANANETLAAMSKKNLAELASDAVAQEAHCEIITKHLLSWEMIPIWNKENKIILLEINLSFGKKTARYFLSTAVALQK